MATSRRKKKDYLNIQTVNKRIRKLALEALNAEMIDKFSNILGMKHRECRTDLAPELHSIVNKDKVCWIQVNRT